MSDNSSYLRLAERVIGMRGVPLTGAEIIEDARILGDIPAETYPTIVKTLQARLAEDLAENQGRSRFIRTGIGTYFLRRLLGRRTIFGKVTLRPERKGRAKPYPSRVLVLDSSEVDTVLRAETLANQMKVVAAKGTYKTSSALCNRDVPVITATSLRFGPSNLEYEVGQHSHFSALCGAKTGLVRRYIDEYDFDFFHTEPIGAVQSSARAIWPLLQKGRKSRHNPRYDRIEKIVKLKCLKYDSATSCLCVVGHVVLDDLFESRPQVVRRLEFRKPSWNLYPTGGILDHSQGFYDQFYVDVLRLK